jgi:predicted AlkP superfamily pyrophosphatase or phosphodiesterase
MRRMGVSLGAALALAAATAQAAPVLMISIDGLRPGDVLEGPQRGVSDPVLQALARDGAYATGVRNVLPTVTYPNHTTLITGVWPARHGIANNTTFDHLRKNMEGWYWYSPMIKVPTLWDAVHAAGRPVSSLSWPVSVDNHSINFDIPEVWRARTPDDFLFVHALSTPGLPEAIEARAHVGIAQTRGSSVPADEARAKAAAAMIALEHPAFFTLHLVSLDATQHAFGPGSAQAHETLAHIDTAVGGLVAAARKEQPDIIVVIVSDHGFAPVEHDIDLAAAFVEAGLITLDASGKPVAWQAAPWDAGGSAAVVLAHPEDAAVRARVAALLDHLKADPASGIGAVIDRAGIAAMGGAPDADFWVDAQIGYEFGDKLTGPLLAPPLERGTHGYFPQHPEMRSTFIVAGPGVTAHGSLGEVDMRDIAPTVAKVLGVSLPSAEGKALF